MISNNRCLVNYNYIVYGLNVKSQIPLPELIEAEEPESEPSEVTITYGIVPKEVNGAVINGEYIKLSKREFYLYIKGTAYYYVTNGSRIIVEPEEQSDIEEMKVFLLGSCFGMLLTQRNIIGIHGGSMVIDGQGIIITGNTGAGKSTLTSALRKNGYSFLADDVSALGKDRSSKLIIHPTYPQVKLCRDAMEKMGYDPNRFRVTDPCRDKFAVPIRKNFSEYPVILSAIYEVSTSDVGVVEMTEVLGAGKVSLILRNIYRIEISKVLGFTHEYFKQCLEIAKHIPIYRIVRPKNGYTVDEQIKLISETMSRVTGNII